MAGPDDSGAQPDATDSQDGASIAGLTQRQLNRELRAAVRARKRYERRESKRFTKATRRRRRTILIAVGSTVLLVGALVGVVYSPAFAVRHISFTGLDRLERADLRDAVDSQIGVPIGFVDYSEISAALSGFSLIQSYTVESRPPDRLIIRITEREPIAVLKDDEGYHSVDAAGVQIEVNDERPEGLPLVDSTDGDGFAAVAQVLLTIPSSLLSTIDTISASSMDDVSFVLAGVGQEVFWGSAEDSVAKSVRLEALVGTVDPATVVTYDVSSLEAPVVRS